MSWRELPRVKGAGAFDVLSVPTRLARGKTDPWEGYAELRQRVSAKMLRALQ